MAVFGRIAESRLREAIKEGKLDRLPNQGQPIDLEWYFALPEELRLAYGLLKSNGCAPQEVEMLREIAALEERVKAEPDGDTKKSLVKQLADQRLRLRLLLERPPDRG